MFLSSVCTFTHPNVGTVNLLYLQNLPVPLSKADISVKSVSNTLFSDETILKPETTQSPAIFEKPAPVV